VDRCQPSRQPTIVETSASANDRPVDYHVIARQRTIAIDAKEKVPPTGQVHCRCDPVSITEGDLFLPRIALTREESTTRHVVEAVPAQRSVMDVRNSLEPQNRSMTTRRGDGVEVTIARKTHDFPLRLSPRKESCIFAAPFAMNEIHGTDASAPVPDGRAELKRAER
jgi:hypothetical protein